MKVLQINATYADGSTGTIVRDIQQCCEDNGIECHVAYSLSQIPEGQVKNGYKMGCMYDRKIHALLSRINGAEGYFSKNPTRYLKRYIDKLKPDVVHLHNLHNNYINVNMLLQYLAEKDIPTVVTLHDCWFFTGGCFHYADAGCSRWQKQCGRCPKKYQDYPAYFLDKSRKILSDRYRYFGAIKNITAVGVSEWITAECQKSVFKNRRCTTIYNGIDTDIFKPTDSDIRKRYALEDKFVVLGPASKWLDPVNSDVLCKVSRGLDDDTVLVLFGNAPSHRSLPKNVINIGYTDSREDLARLYSAADVFVNCTREDSLSLINIEAQACGTPVITFNNTGARETVSPTMESLVNTGDGTILLERIRELKAKPNTISRDAVRNRIIQKFDKNVNYKKYISLYHEIVR